MKRFVIREVETLKTTAAVYGCDCCCEISDLDMCIYPDHASDCCW